MELVLELLLKAAVAIPKKKWAKTVLFVIVTQLIAALCVWVNVTSPVRGKDASVDVLGCVVISLWCLGMLVLAVIGHKHNWRL